MIRIRTSTDELGPINVTTGDENILWGILVTSKHELIKLGVTGITPWDLFEMHMIVWKGVGR